MLPKQLNFFAVNHVDFAHLLKSSNVETFPGPHFVLKLKISVSTLFHHPMSPKSFNVIAVNHVDFAKDTVYQADKVDKVDHDHVDDHNHKTDISTTAT